MGFSKTKNGTLCFWANSSMHKQKYSDKEVLKMKNRILNGETYQSIAEDYGVTRATIAKIIKRRSPIVLNISIPKYFMALDLFCSINFINYNTAIYHIRTKDIKTIKVSNKLYIHKDTDFNFGKTISEDIIDSIIKLRKEKYNITAIANKLKINRKTVRSYLELYSWEFEL